MIRTIMTFCSNCRVEFEKHPKFCPGCWMRLEKIEQASVLIPLALLPITWNYRNVPLLKNRILGRVDIDQEDIDDVAQKAKKGLGVVWRFARKGISKGADLAGQGIEAREQTHIVPLLDNLDKSSAKDWRSARASLIK